VGEILDALSKIKETFAVNAAHRDLQKESLDLLKAYKDALKHGQEIGSYVTADMWQDHQLTKKRCQKLGVQLKEYSVATEETKEIKGQWYQATTFTDGKNLSTGVLDADDRYQEYSSASSKLKVEDKHNRKYMFISSIILEDERIVCPACGNPNTREVLYEGCPFCRTKFNIYEFDNKLSHVIPEVVGNREMNRVIKLAVVIAVLITLIGIIVSQNILMLIMVPLIFFISYLLASLLSLPKIVHSRVKWQRTQRLQWDMQKIDEHFSYDHFLGTALHRLKVWALADDANMLQLTSGKTAPDCGIVDVDVVEYRSAKINGNQVILEAEAVFVTCDNGKLQKEHKNIGMTFARDPRAKTQLRIDFEHLKCPSCGASIRLADGATCRYCRNSLSVENFDWVLVDVTVTNPSIFQKFLG
jgi:rubrerythrin/exosome complex RNA-binding protein Csl4